jgi:hypothetical protein
MKYEDFLELLKYRRSIRKFKPEPIPDEYVTKILDATPKKNPGAGKAGISGCHRRGQGLAPTYERDSKDGYIQIIRSYAHLFRLIKFCALPDNQLKI